MHSESWLVGKKTTAGSSACSVMEVLLIGAAALGALIWGRLDTSI